jgi:hypothetical protein
MHCGGPRHVKVTVKVIGIVDHELLEFHWGPDWLVWDARKTEGCDGGIARQGHARPWSAEIAGPSRSAASLLIASSRVSSRLQKANRTK